MKRYTLTVTRYPPLDAFDWCEECGRDATYWLDRAALCDEHFPERAAESFYHAKLASKTVGAWS